MSWQVSRIDAEMNVCSEFVNSMAVHLAQYSKGRENARGVAAL